MTYPDESEGRGGGTGPRYETTGEATTEETTTGETTTDDPGREPITDGSGGEPTSGGSGMSGPDTPAVEGDALVDPGLESEGDLTSADELTALANGEAPPDAWTTGASAETPDHPDGDAPDGDARADDAPSGRDDGDAPSRDSPSGRDDGDGTRS